MRVVILRLGHREKRDKRTTSHLALAARAFGADGMILADTHDETLLRTVNEIVDRWGGNFYLKTNVPYKKAIKEWKDKGGEIIHLTMYGLPIDEILDNIRNSEKDKMIVVGSQKVPAEIFEIADYNVAIGHQPHSEISALAIFLDRLFKGEELYRSFDNAKVRVLPSNRGKKLWKSDQF